MSKFSNTIEFNLKTTLDSTGITQLQQQLSRVSAELKNMETAGDLGKNFSSAAQDVEKLQSALAKSFNSVLNVFDLNKFKNRFQLFLKSILNF